MDALVSEKFSYQKNLLQCQFFGLKLNQMVKCSKNFLNRTFAALADPTRRRILSQLAHGDGCVTDLVRPHAMSLAAVSKHLAVLERAGLVRRRRIGRVHSVALEPGPMREAQAWIDRTRDYWEGSLDHFENYLNPLQIKPNKNQHHDHQ